MADRWIVSSYEFRHHMSLADAEREAARLAEKTGKVMHVHRVKTTLQRSEAMAVIERLNARIAELEVSIGAAACSLHCAPGPCRCFPLWPDTRQ